MLNLLKKIKNIDDSIKKSAQLNREKQNKKSQKMEEKSEVERVKSEKRCKQKYLDITSDKDTRKQLYKNIDIEFEYFEGKITEQEYENQMKKHKQKIDKLLSSLNFNNVTCEDIWNLHNIK